MNWLGYAYGAGFIFWLLRMGYNWDNIDWDTPFPAFAVAFWPLALPVAVGRLIRRRQRHKELAAKERQQWLEAKID